ncbi:MAG: Asp-tRNA(Asn)/Glu-tRNA(Gln) amidotransferase GatCAB subunit [Gammaproteobacteria bacterium]|jgi:aspartyl-tRNA(Asn)/glutamyl-tRNA(Gln) amidotransferase subunit C|nr:Asp-tRNA(Asn)/Glu-tRNA(Gln) amidotransferase GatCAB subunit [Gammaproteobacteria bacterium]
MSVEEKTVCHIARLAHLDITDGQVQKYAHDLNNILSMVKEMEKLNTDHIEPMTHPLKQNQRLRKDIVIESNQREVFQKIAPATAAGLYLVPQVIE